MPANKDLTYKNTFNTQKTKVDQANEILKQIDSLYKQVRSLQEDTLKLEGRMEQLREDGVIHADAIK